MNSDAPKTPRQELEASLTALLLGELPADKAAALRELMAKDVELTKLYERLEQTIGLVRETAAPAEQGTQSAPLKFSTKRREQLFAHFKTVAPKEFAKPKRLQAQARELAIAAGIVAFIGAAAWFMSQESFSSMSRIGSEPRPVQISGVPASAPQSPVASVSDQTTARLAAEQALEMAQNRIVPVNASAGGGSGGIGSPSQTVFYAASAGKPIVSGVALPTATDYEVNGKDTSVSLLVSTNYISSDPQWLGILEKGNYSSLAHSSTNQFVSRYASIALPTNTTDLEDIANLAYAPRGQFVPNPTATNASEFAFYSDLNRNGRFGPQGVSDDSTKSDSRSTGGFGRTGTGINYAKPSQITGALHQLDEMSQRQSGGLASADNMHSKQDDTVLAVGATEQMSRSKIQEGLRNSSENKPGGTATVIDPATGEAIPVSEMSQHIAAIDPATGLPIPVEASEANGKMPALRTQGTRAFQVDTNAFFAAIEPFKETVSQTSSMSAGTGGGGGGGGPATVSGLPARTLRLPPQSADATATASTPITGEKLAEVVQQSKDASGSNIYLGRELAKADVKFGTWALDAGGMRHETKKEEERLEQVGKVRDGVTAVGQGFGPKEMPAPPVEGKTVPALGDLPMLGKAFRSEAAERKPGSTATSAAPALLAHPGLPVSTNAFQLVAKTKEELSGYVDTQVEWNFGTGKANIPSIANLGDVPSFATEPSNELGGSFYYRGQGTQPNWVKNFTIQDDSGVILARGTNATRERDARLFFEMGKLDEAEALFNQSAKEDPDNHATSYYLNLIKDARYRRTLTGNELVARQAMVDIKKEQLGTEGDKETELALNYSNVSGEDRKKASKSPAGESNLTLYAGAPVTSQGASKVDPLNVVGYYDTSKLSESDRSALSNQPSQSLSAKLADQDAKIREAQTDVDRLRRQYNIADPLVAADAPTMLMSAEESRKLEGMRVELEVQVMREETQLEALKKMPRDKLVYSLPTAAPDAALTSLVEQRSMTKQALIAKQKDYGVEHPEVVKLRSALEDLNGQIDNQVDGILLGLDTRVSAAREQLNKLKNEVEKAKTNDIAIARRTQPYWEAKRELDNLRRFSAVLASKIAAENIEASLPKTTMVEIMDDALPAKTANAGLWDRLRGKGKYESQARIKVERDQSDISFSNDPRAITQYDPRFIQNEFETIKSDKVLSNVVAALNLQKQWSKDGQTLSANEAIALLKQKLDLKPVRNTSFIDIEAKSDKPEEAAELANAVARSYKDYRQEIRKELSRGGIMALKEQMGEQAAKVREAEKELDRLRAEQGIEKAPPAGIQPTVAQPPTNQQVDVAPPKPTVPPPVPQPEVQTSENAFSTFSLNVSDVAFKLAAASLEKGQMPEPASIRSEEFINAFDYRDPEAPAGVPVAFAWERARYPYAQNRDLLRFSIKTAAQGRQAGRPLNLVLLMDNSGSMERADRVAIIREALKVLASQLQPQDKLSVITFARTAQLRVDGVAGSQAAQVAEELGGLTPEGGTNIEEAMNLAYQTALRHYLANGINRVVLLTDGAANLGNVEPDSLKEKVEANRKQGIALDCFGIGWEGFNDDLLETLSRNGDGRYGFINSPEEAATEFAGQLAGALNVAASDVKVQVEFNPARVTAYRQIGYAKHQLTKEQFRDNTVDAAEIAAQEAGNALYVIEVNPAGQGPLGTVRVRFKIPDTSDYREHEWSVPFNGNAVALEQASPAMRLAATASAFSEWLATSPYATEVTPDTLLSNLSGVPEVYGADTRPKKLEWMIRQAKSLAGGEIRNSNIETRNNGEDRNSKAEVRSKPEESKVQFP